MSGADYLCCNKCLKKIVYAPDREDDLVAFCPECVQSRERKAWDACKESHRETNGHVGHDCYFATTFDDYLKSEEYNE